MDFRLEGKVAFITGSAGGIGAAIAETLGREGARVTIADVDIEKAQSTAEHLSGLDISAIAVRIDVASASSVAEAIAAAADQHGPTDILVNNAGFTRDNRIERMSEDDWDAVIDVVLKGAFLCTKAALPAMIEKQAGRIINIASRAYLGNPGQANYSSAKAGILGLTRAMALENGRYNITVNAVAPGIIDTEAVRSLRHFEKIKSSAEASLPLPRLGTVEDVASAVTFLASAHAGYITGDVLHVTGGRYG